MKMFVRKRTWTNAKGEEKEAWIVWYADQHGKPHIKTFAKKKEADAYHAIVKVEVRQGVHTPDSASLTIAEAGDAWIKTCEANKADSSLADLTRLDVADSTGT
jgi:integrase